MDESIYVSIKQSQLYVELEVLTIKLHTLGEVESHYPHQV